MEKRKMLSGVLLAIFTLLCSSFAMAAWSVTVENPAASGTIQGTYILNASITAGGDHINVTQVVFAVLCSDTANSTYATIATNSSNNDTVYTHSWVSTAAEDSASCTIRATATNESATTVLDTSTSVTIDNTVPQAPTSMSPTTGSTRKDVAFSAAVTGSNTTGCSMTFISPTYSDTVTMTHSADTCTHTLTLPSSGNFQYYVTATDGLNTSRGATTNLKVDETGGFITVTGGDDSGSAGTSKKNVVIILLLIFAIFGYTQGWFGGNSKKSSSSTRKRRKSRR